MSAILAEQRARFWGTLANRTVVVNRGRQKQKLK
jgi:ABC-type branched-subunit amino acid transport system ATPase component